MDCPSCGEKILQPAQLQPGLPGYACSNCQGFLLDVLVYRNWLERSPEGNAPRERTLESTEDSKKAMLCPKCSRIMAKYRMSGEVQNRMDVCGFCGELWLDGGEWVLLNQLDLSAKLPQLLSEPWQRRVRTESIQESIEREFESGLGTEDYSRVSAFRSWMMSHEKAALIWDYLLRRKRR